MTMSFLSTIALALMFPHHKDDEITGMSATMIHVVAARTEMMGDRSCPQAHYLPERVTQAHQEDHSTSDDSPFFLGINYNRNTVMLGLKNADGRE